MPSQSQPPNLLVLDVALESTPEFDISDPELLRTLESSQRSHFWFGARNRQILEFLRKDGVAPPARILEIGCGSGTVLSALAAAGYEMAGVEMHLDLAKQAAQSNPDARIFAANILSPPPALIGGKFDAVGFFDVLEHVEGAEAVLRSCVGLLRAGGRLVGTVPALPMLWSDYDALAGHRLRYDRRQLRALLERAGLPAPHVAYFFQTLLPGMLARRALVGRGRANGDERRRTAHRALDAPGRLLNSFFAALCDAERSLRRAVAFDSIPGTSLWFSARIP